MAEILSFPAKARGRARKAPAWADQHFPLIAAAMDLGQTNDAEFRKRCRLIIETEGRSILAKMAAQLDRLATALSLTSRRIRNLTAEGTLA